MEQLSAVMTRLKKIKNTQVILESSNEVQYDCPECKDREIAIVKENGVWVGKPCHCKERKRMRRLIKSSGLTEMLQSKTFRNFTPSARQQEMYNVAVSYVREFDKIKQKRCNGLAFTGSVGAGKTHLLAAIANNLLAKRIQVCFVNTPSFISELRKSQFQEGKLDQQIELISNAEVVIFDDLAKEKTSEWVQNQYYEIINNRYISHLPTLFSTNCDMDQIEDKLGDATASRLYAMTKDRLIHVIDDDHRMAGL